jgi:hypothetical protein
MILFGTFFGPQGEYQAQTLFGRLLAARRKTCNSPPHETATMWHSELGFTMRQIVALTHIIYGDCHLLLADRGPGAGENACLNLVSVTKCVPQVLRTIVFDWPEEVQFGESLSCVNTATHCGGGNKVSG